MARFQWRKHRSRERKTADFSTYTTPGIVLVAEHLIHPKFYNNIKALKSPAIVSAKEPWDPECYSDHLWAVYGGGLDFVYGSEFF